MFPNREQIAQAAYFRWLNRGAEHGGDRDDWLSAERDLTFGMNYRWLVRHALGAGTTASSAAPALLGKNATEPAGARRRCRFCERSAPVASFDPRPLPMPSWLANANIQSWDECEDCRAHFEAHLAGPLAEFADALREGGLETIRNGTISVAALKALVRVALAFVPATELHHFEDALEWVSNPDDDRDAVLLEDLGLGCHVYQTPETVPAPFASLARRSDDEAPVPYMMFFLGGDRLVLQTALPFSPRDEGLDEADDRRIPMLSLTMGRGTATRSSEQAFVPVALPRGEWAELAVAGVADASAF